MKRRIAVLGALCALMLFSSSAFAQTFDVYRKATVEELSHAGKILAQAGSDSVVFDYPEDPLSIAGIHVISLDTTVFPFADEINGTFYIEEGEHFVSCENPDAHIRGLWFLAPGAHFGTGLSIGGEGELTQILGNGPENDAITLFYAQDISTYNTVIAGSGGIILYAGTAHFEKTYITNSGNWASFPTTTSTGESAAFMNRGAGINGWVPTVFSMKNVLCWNNTSWDMNVYGENYLFDFSATNSSFMSHNDKGGHTVVIDYDNGLSRVEFMDCRFAEVMEKEITGEYGFPRWMGEHMNDGSMFFRETRPGGITGTSIVQLWPHGDTPLIRTDFTGNGVVELSDFLYLAADYGSKVGTTQFAHIYDLDMSEFVDMPDLKAVIRDYFVIPQDYELSEIVNDSEMLASLEQRAIPLLEALDGYREVKDAVMEHPELGPLMRAFITTAVAEVEGETPDGFVLGENFPNPFNSQTTIQFSLAYDTPVTIAIYNMAGQEVVRVADEVLSAGNYTVQWDGKTSNGLSVASGTYLFRITAGEYVKASKMLLLR